MEKKIGVIDGAKIMEGATLTFEDSDWTPTIDELIKVSSRTKFIEAQIQSNIKTARLKDYIEARALALGITLNRPRGQQSKPESEGFLSNLREQNHSAYILSLHFGSSEPSLQNENVGNYSVLKTLKRRLSVYNRYQQKYCTQDDTAIISFEDYVLMIEAVSKGLIKFLTHQDCGSRIPVRASRMNLKCGICDQHGPEIKKSRQKIEAIMSNAAAAAKVTFSGSGKSGHKKT
jgi:hypothetical protein